MLIKSSCWSVRTVYQPYDLADLKLVEWVIEAHPEILFCHPPGAWNGCYVHANRTMVVVVKNNASYKLTVLLKTNSA